MSSQYELRKLEPSDIPSCEAVLRALPEWFGIESALNEYVNCLHQLPAVVATMSDQVIGFIALEDHNEHSSEIHVMAVHPEHHRFGVGRTLVDACAFRCQLLHCKWLLVRTIGPSSSDPHYAKTRKFYEAIGFTPLFESNELWGATNPCLVMVRSI